MKDVTVIDLFDQVRTRGGPFLQRLEEAKRRAVRIASKLERPRMHTPPRWDDDNIFIEATLEDALSSIRKLHVRSNTCCFCLQAFPDINRLKAHGSGCEAHPLYKKPAE